VQLEKLGLVWAAHEADAGLLRPQIQWLASAAHKGEGSAA